MKKIILITIVCLLIPCFGFAQEPNSLLGIDNTLWQSIVDERGDLGFGFYGGKVYLIWPLEGGEPEMAENSFYVDLPQYVQLFITLSRVLGGIGIGIGICLILYIILEQ